MSVRKVPAAIEFVDIAGLVSGASQIDFQIRAALLDCDESLKIRPNHPNTLNHRALAHLALGDLDDAFADYANVLQQKPKNADALYGRGMIKLRKGDVAGGNDDMSSARAVQKDIADDFAKYGLTAEKQ